MKLPDLKSAVEALFSQGTADFLLLGERIANGEDWDVIEYDGRRAIMRQVMCQAALGRGSFDNLDAKSVARLASVQFAYFDGFIKDAKAGKLGAQWLPRRLAMYPEAIRAVYENERSAAQKDEGFSMACRILSNSDHCDGCVEAAADGWVPIDEVLPIGAATCGGRCNCTIIYKRNENSPTAPAAQRAIQNAQDKARAYADIKAKKEGAE